MERRRSRTRRRSRNVIFIFKRREELQIEKTKYSSFRVTPEEKELIKKRSKVLGLTESEYLRRIIFAKDKPELKTVKYVFGKDGLKERVVATRFTELEYSEIEQKAKKANMTMSRLLAFSTLQKEINVIDGAKELAHQLSKAGNNLNQLAMLANQGKFPKTPDIDDTRKVVKQIWQLLSSSMGKTKQKKV